MNERLSDQQIAEKTALINDPKLAIETVIKLMYELLPYQEDKVAAIDVIDSLSSGISEQSSYL